MIKLLTVCVLGFALTAHGGLVGVLSSGTGAGLISGGKTWLSEGEGLTVSWTVSQNTDGSWHYRYDFAGASGEALAKPVNHFIITASDHIGYDELSNFSAGVEEYELGTFGPGVANPSFPVTAVYGLKISLYEEQALAEFDSVRRPMWGDIYLKGGGNPKNYGYNSDFGIAALNLHNYLDVPVDAAGGPLFKVLVPNALPEPATLAILCSGLLLIKYN